MLDDAAAASLLSRSPFAPDRSAFTRLEASVGPERPAEVRLVAIFTRDGARHAALVFDGEERVVAVGEETPIGAVVRIDPESVAFGPEPLREVGLFE